MLEDPTARCKKGLDPLTGEKSCPERKTLIADEIFGLEIEEPSSLSDSVGTFVIDESELKPIEVKTPAEAYIDHEVAMFRAQLCLDDPDSFSWQEKVEICEQLNNAELAADEAVRREVNSWPPELKELFVRFASEHSGQSKAWWRTFLEE